jgi:putative phosphoesterase
MVSQRLLVISDTHGNVPALDTVLRWAGGIAVSAAVFLGDGINDISHATAGSSVEWRIIRGNNDYSFSVPEASVLDFGGKRFFLCHGHHYALYNGYHTLITAARGMNADAVLFGHTHVPYREDSGGVLLVNPGSIGRPRSIAGATFALIECTPEQPLAVQFWGINAKGDIREIDVLQSQRFRQPV